ncbi:hypothetical protein [Halorhabdus utahensis]|nr:hypothetical protein [Halorhabdus utahensis]
MSSTMAVIGVGTAVVFLGALAALRWREDELLAAGLLTLGSGLATIWSLLGVGWAGSGRGEISTTMYLSLALMGGMTTLYFGIFVRSRLRSR